MKKLLLVSVLLLSSLAGAENINLTVDNTVTLRGEVNPLCVAKAKLELAALDKKRGFLSKAPIYLVIQSPGGSIFDGLDLIDTIKSISNVHTITYFAASMASAIVQQAPGTRYGKGSAVSMFHRAAGGVQGTFETGNLETRLDLYKRIVRSMEYANANRMGLTLAEYKAKVREELWIYGSENLNQKALDKIVGITCSPELVLKKDTVLFDTMFGTIKINFSGCPELKIPSGGADESSDKVYRTTVGKTAVMSAYLGVFKGVIL